MCAIHHSQAGLRRKNLPSLKTRYQHSRRTSNHVTTPGSPFTAGTRHSGSLPHQRPTGQTSNSTRRVRRATSTPNRPSPTLHCCPSPHTSRRRDGLHVHQDASQRVQGQRGSAVYAVISMVWQGHSVYYEPRPPLRHQRLRQRVGPAKHR